MRKSLMAVIMGIISSSIELLFSLFMIFVLSLTSDIANSLSETANVELSIILVLGWLMVLGAILAIVGSALCGKRSRLGGILILVGVAMCLGITYFNISGLFTDGLTASAVAMFIFNVIPLLLMTISGFVGIFAKTKTINNDEFVNTKNDELN